MATQNPSFGFTDYGTESADIERRRKYAEMLREQSMQPLEGGMAGGWAIPISPTQGLAKALQAYAGAKGMQQATNEQKALGGRYQSDLAKALQAADLARTGRAAMPSKTVGDPLYEGEMTTPATPEVKPDKGAEIQALMSHPLTQSLGMQEYQKNAEEARRKMMLQSLGFGAQQANPQQALSAESMGGGQAGPTNAAASRLGQPNAGMSVSPMTTQLLMAGTADPFPKLAEFQNANEIEKRKVTAGRAGAPMWGQDANGNPIIIGFNPKLESGQTMSPQGNVSTVPGYLQSQSELGLTPYQEVKNPDQTTSFIPKNQLLQPQGQQQLQQQGQPQPGQMPVTPFNQLPANEQQLARSVQAAADQGQPLTLRGPQPGPAKYGQTQQQQIQQKEAEKVATVSGEGVGKIYNDIQESSFSANRRKLNIDRLGDLLSKLQTGKLTPIGTELSAWAKSFGIPVGENVGNAQAATAIANELALQLRNPQGGAGMPGALSDSDRNFLVSMLASIGKDPQANTILLDGMKKLADRDQQIAKLARDYKKKNGGFDEGFLSEVEQFANENPLFDQPNKPTSQQPLPGMPAGSVRIGKTPEGRTVYKAPNGKQYVE